jgi:hypothetical protein
LPVAGCRSPDKHKAMTIFIVAQIFFHVFDYNYSHLL